MKKVVKETGGFPWCMTTEKIRGVGGTGKKGQRGRNYDERRRGGTKRGPKKKARSQRVTAWKTGGTGQKSFGRKHAWGGVSN